MNWNTLLRRNNTKGQISKRVLQENKAHQIFRKAISYPLIRTSVRIKNVSFSEKLGCFASCNIRFEILTFTLSPTIIDFNIKNSNKTTSVGVNLKILLN